MNGIKGDLALRVVEHSSIDDLRRIYPFIEPPFPERGPYIEPGTASKGKIIDKPPIARVHAALAEHEKYNILVLEKSCELSDILWDKLSYQNKIVTIQSSCKMKDALSLMKANRYDLITSALETEEDDKSGIVFSKLVKVVDADNKRIKDIQDRYKSVPLILCEPGGDFFAVFLESKQSPIICHLFSYSREAYAATAKHFMGMPDPGYSPFHE